MARLISSLWTGALLLLTLVLLGIAAAPAFGLRATVLTGASMEPAFPSGGMVLVKDTEPSEVRPGDVITYLGRNDALTTHRVVSLHELEGGLHFRTQGDANPSPDVDLTPGGALVGVVVADVSWAAPLLTIFTGSRARLLVPGLLAMWLAIAEIRDIRAFRRAQREPEVVEQTEGGADPAAPVVPAPPPPPPSAPVLPPSGFAAGPPGMIPIVPAGAPSPPPGFAPVVVWMAWPPQLVWPTDAGPTGAMASSDEAVGAVPDTIPTWLQTAAEPVEPPTAPTGIAAPAPSVVRMDAPLFATAELATRSAPPPPAPAPPAPAPRVAAGAPSWLALPPPPLPPPLPPPAPAPNVASTTAPLFADHRPVPGTVGPTAPVGHAVEAAGEPSRRPLRRSRLGSRLTGTLLIVSAFGAGVLTAGALLTGTDDVTVQPLTTLTLAAPTSISASGGCTGLSPIATVIWADVADEDGYDVLRRVGSSGPFTTVGSVGADVLTFTDTTVALATTYEYAVQATREGWTSSLGTEDGALTPAVCV